ncbi:MAG: chromosome segregation protein SMC [Bacteroidota bacterium]|nr:chromosome segregation protein SMC [Bacteroidota bacterium]
MYLSRLEVVGFKSFANKVQVKFDAGITAIVGPNGCGKTNVVDSIRWVLGEQKPSTLRSDKMEDVIFNGTKSRKPLGMADVSLTIENTKGILPSEYSEITITRRVYRSGESEYFLNKTLCRLKDIRDLFMDTGMGSDAYSVIELKMVETILSDRTDERRRLFEEAAGVTKYKHRRKEALRRLDSVQQDLVRVNDIVKEVQKVVGSLERQAQKAEMYNGLIKVLREREIALLEREYAELTKRMIPLKEQLTGARTEKERIDSQLSHEEMQLEAFREKLSALETQLTASQTELSHDQQQINQEQQRQISASERKRSLSDSIARYEKEKLELRQQQNELEQCSVEVRAAMDTAHVKVEQAEKNYSAKKEDLDAFGVQLDAKKSEVKRLQDRILELIHTLSEKRQAGERTKARIENIRGRIEYSSEENGIYQNEIDTNTELVTKLTAEDKTLRKQFAEAEVRVHEKEAYKQSLEREVQELRNRELETRGILDRRRSRLDFLKGLVESFDGLSEGTKFLFTNEEFWKSAASGRASVQTTVADALTTDAEYRVAIEAALGEAAGFIVVNNVEEAHRGIEFLKQNQKGKATFICLDRIPSVSRNGTIIRGDGIIGTARNVVRSESQYAPLFDYLLDGVVLVRDVNVAARYVERSEIPQGGIDAGSVEKFVTLEGEMVSSEGLLKGGSTRSDEGGMIGKKSQIAELEEEIAVLEKELAHHRAEIDKRTATLNALDLKGTIEEAKRVEQKMTAVEMRIAQIEFEKKRIAENVQRNIAENSRLAAEADAMQEELDVLLPEVAKVEEERSLAEQHAGAVSSELETMEVLWSEYSRAANEAHVAVLNLENEESKFARELEYTRATIENIAAAQSQREKDITGANAEIERLTSELAQSESTITRMQEELRTLILQRKEVDAEYNAKRDAMHQLELKIKDERRLHDDSMGATHDLEMKVSELTMKCENLVARAKEEFDFALQSREFSPGEPFDFETGRAEVQKLKEHIEALGAVNFAAFDEFKTESERLEFITTQRDDLLESEKTLLATIEEINTTAQRMFLETFGKIRENFISTFKALFDEGDECDLRLEENVDPLEARIEIIAKPRGKRPTSIDLLSAGEKTLTAIALLFAIYLVKPSPFCILDEVDAPLDDSNIDRFARILRKFSDNTQFIVVTHNKRTMEAANAMYGVTMEEEGISKLVSVRFNENKVTTN